MPAFKLAEAISRRTAKLTHRWRNLRRFPLRESQISNRILFEISRPAETLPYRPIWLLLYLTDACNLRCRMCPHHTPLPVADFPYQKQLTYNMSSDVLTQILRRFPETITVSLAGVGEPTLHPDFPLVIDRLAEHQMITDVTTNGYFLHGKRAHAVTHGRYVREVSISLNGYDEEEHQRVTGRKGFKQVIENVRRLVMERARTGSPYRISVSQVCRADNVDLWTDYVRFASDLGVDRLYLHNNIDMNVNADDLRSLRTTTKIEAAIGALPSSVGSLEVVRPVPIGNFRPPPKCEWFFRNLAFDAAGHLGACGRVMNPQPSQGNVWDQEDPWNNAYMRELRSTFLDPSGGLLKDPCKVCVENYG